MQFSKPELARESSTFAFTAILPWQINSILIILVSSLKYGKKSKSYLQEDWRNYFGTPVEEHEDSYKINLADGYITTQKT